MRPIDERIPAVMAAVERHQDRTGRTVMMAFNITDDIDAMRRHADLVEREGGTCVMASLNWCGLCVDAGVASIHADSLCTDIATATAR